MHIQGQKFIHENPPFTNRGAENDPVEQFTLLLAHIPMSPHVCKSKTAKRHGVCESIRKTPSNKSNGNAGQISTAHSKRYLHGLATTHMFPSIFLRDVPHLRITIRLVANVCRTKFLDILWCLSCSLFSIWP